MGLEVTVDHDRCVGTTMCTLTTPAVYSLDDGGQAVAGDPSAATRDEVVDGASQCPMEAITVTDVDTGEVLFP